MSPRNEEQPPRKEKTDEESGVATNQVADNAIHNLNQRLPLSASNVDPPSRLSDVLTTPPPVENGALELSSDSGQSQQQPGISQHDATASAQTSSLPVPQLPSIAPLYRSQFLETLQLRRSRIPNTPIHGTTAYDLEIMLDTNKPPRKSIRLDSPELRFDGGRCLFLASAKQYWDLLTTVYTMWDRPQSSGPLRALSPWGTTTFYKVNFETYAHYEPTPYLDNITGPCRHLRDHDDVWAFMNEASFYGDCKMVHMQEETARRIYKYAKDVVVKNDLRSADEIESIGDVRDAWTYS
nr:uncharacterized protein CI109_006026 [Kwoniella shandongensis]KAA5525718.1 hypothetical protein CI109_006026 [Kwoniella shandongensis]